MLLENIPEILKLSSSCLKSCLSRFHSLYNHPAIVPCTCNGSKCAPSPGNPQQDPKPSGMMLRHHHMAVPSSLLSVSPAAPRRPSTHATGVTCVPTQQVDMGPPRETCLLHPATLPAPPHAMPLVPLQSHCQLPLANR
jgi:hypothetical protein